MTRAVGRRSTGCMSVCDSGVVRAARPLLRLPCRSPGTCASVANVAGPFAGAASLISEERHSRHSDPHGARTRGKRCTLPANHLSVKCSLFGSAYTYPYGQSVRMCVSRFLGAASDPVRGSLYAAFLASTYRSRSLRSNSNRRPSLKDGICLFQTRVRRSHTVQERYCAAAFTLSKRGSTVTTVEGDLRFLDMGHSCK